MAVWRDLNSRSSVHHNTRHALAAWCSGRRLGIWNRRSWVRKLASFCDLICIVKCCWLKDDTRGHARLAPKNIIKHMTRYVDVEPLTMLKTRVMPLYLYILAWLRLLMVSHECSNYLGTYILPAKAIVIFHWWGVYVRTSRFWWWVDHFARIIHMCSRLRFFYCSPII
jgi:hypothetical protein